MCKKKTKKHFGIVASFIEYVYIFMNYSLCGQSLIPLLAPYNYRFQRIDTDFSGLYFVFIGSPFFSSIHFNDNLQIGYWIFSSSYSIHMRITALNILFMPYAGVYLFYWFICVFLWLYDWWYFLHYFFVVFAAVLLLNYCRMIWKIYDSILLNVWPTSDWQYVQLWSSIYFFLY